MRVNIYAEEMTDRIEIIEKEIDGVKFEALRFYMYLPTSYKFYGTNNAEGIRKSTDIPHGNVRGPFIHREGDDDSAAITFWSRGKLRETLQKAIEILDIYHAEKNRV